MTSSSTKSMSLMTSSFGFSCTQNPFYFFLEISYTFFSSRKSDSKVFGQRIALRVCRMDRTQTERERRQSGKEKIFKKKKVIPKKESLLSFSKRGNLSVFFFIWNFFLIFLIFFFFFLFCISAAFVVKVLQLAEQARRNKYEAKKLTQLSQIWKKQSDIFFRRNQKTSQTFKFSQKIFPKLGNFVKRKSNFLLPFSFLGDSEILTPRSGRSAGPLQVPSMMT